MTPKRDDTEDAYWEAVAFVKQSEQRKEMGEEANICLSHVGRVLRNHEEIL